MERRASFLAFLCGKRALYDIISPSLLTLDPPPSSPKNKRN